MAQLLWYDCTFKKQCTVPVTFTYFQWIEYNPISILYKFQIDISSNSWEIKYQNIGRTHTQTHTQTDRQTDRVKTIPRNPLRGRGNYVDYNNSLIIWVKSQHDLQSTNIAKLESAVHTIVFGSMGLYEPTDFWIFHLECEFTFKTIILALSLCNTSKWYLINRYHTKWYKELKTSCKQTYLAY